MKQLRAFLGASLKIASHYEFYHIDDRVFLESLIIYLESLTDTFDEIKTVANIYHTDPVGDSNPIYRGSQVARQCNES